MNFYSWKENIGIILDWYHLAKKCGELLSQVMNGRKLRNEILNKLKPLLSEIGKNPKHILYLIEIMRY